MEVNDVGRVILPSEDKVSVGKIATFLVDCGSLGPPQVQVRNIKLLNVIFVSLSCYYVSAKTYLFSDNFCHEESCSCNSYPTRKELPCFIHTETCW